MKTEIKKLGKSQVELDFELTDEEFKKYIDKALDHVKNHVKVDGFRKGHVPNHIVEAQIGQENILAEAGDLAVRESYTKYVNENNLEPVGNPEISVTKVAKGSPFGFKATVTVLPEITLPSYKDIAKAVKGQEFSVTEEEVTHALNHLQKSRAKMTLKDGAAEKKDFVEISYQNKDVNDGKEINDQFVLGEGGFMAGFEDQIVGMKAGEEKEFASKFPKNSAQKNLAGKDGMFKVKLKGVQKMELPEISDEFAQQLGGFNSLTALKENVKMGMTEEKAEAEKQRRRNEVLEKITTDTKMELPESMIEYEQDHLLDNFKNQISQQFHLTFEEYLTSIKQTEEAMKESFKKEAEKRLKSFLVLREIGKQEKVEVTSEEISDEINKSVAQYEPAQLAKIDINELKEYTKGVLFNEKVFQILENLSLENETSK
jgi:trigger factor